ncbi:unnamed protein product [Rangifer tarandus platyrhynchus]|uniref:Uncharacterized protein n=3 Tax=Rangifer tarandus platyrhynchus TaxID=3082113 RepID=A0ABN8ZMZ0_RANTA|nr:unnamed protein product [Rangifer tarandus platyrhynchus]CAI9710000.1 unnamed protein product [Rangifer tarandus platyrhynchus]
MKTQAAVLLLFAGRPAALDGCERLALRRRPPEKLGLWGTLTGWCGLISGCGPWGEAKAALKSFVVTAVGLKVIFDHLGPAESALTCLQGPNDRDPRSPYGRMRSQCRSSSEAPPRPHGAFALILPRGLGHWGFRFLPSIVSELGQESVS